MFHKSIIIVVGLLLLTLSHQLAGQIPPGYYNGTNQLTGVPLKAALHDIIKNHTPLTYSQLWQAFISTDAKQNGKVWDMYSDIPGGTPSYEYTFVSDQCGNYNSEGDCYNREHSFPASWFDDQHPMYTDLFHIVPTDGYVNNRRSNFPFGKVGQASWTSTNGSKLGSSSTAGYSGTVFEPVDAYKGDFARELMYMSTRYYQEDSNWPGSDMTLGADLKAWARTLLLQWHTADPVSQKEINRNNAVYQLQNNRNPFIDHPEFAALIWDPSASTDEIAGVKWHVWPNPATADVSVSFDFIDYSSSNITITDLSGRVILIKDVSDDKALKLSLTELSSGFYFLNLFTDGHYAGSQKLIKR